MTIPLFLAGLFFHLISWTLITVSSFIFFDTHSLPSMTPSAQRSLSGLSCRTSCARRDKSVPLITGVAWGVADNRRTDYKWAPWMDAKAFSLTVVEVYVDIDGGLTRIDLLDWASFYGKQHCCLIVTATLVLSCTFLSRGRRNCSRFWTTLVARSWQLEHKLSFSLHRPAGRVFFVSFYGSSERQARQCLVTVFVGSLYASKLSMDVWMYIKASSSETEPGFRLIVKNKKFQHVFLVLQGHVGAS